MYPLVLWIFAYVGVILAADTRRTGTDGIGCPIVENKVPKKGCISHPIRDSLSHCVLKYQEYCTSLKLIRTGVRTRQFTKTVACEPVIPPPDPKAGCHWMPIRDPETHCLVEYEQRCRPANADRCPPISRPEGRLACAYVSLHDDFGCITSFRCEPDGCEILQEPPKRPDCTWFPMRNGVGCTTHFQCLPLYEVAQEVPCPLPAKPARTDCNLVAVSDSNGCIAGFRCDSDTVRRRAPVGGPQCPVLKIPEPVNGCYWIPVKDNNNGCINRYNLRCKPSRPRGCAAITPPVAVIDCNLASVYDEHGCVIKMECESNKCPAIDKPFDQPGCHFVPIRNENGCITDFQCAPEPNACQSVPPKPADNSQCRYETIKDSRGCIVNYRCVLSSPRLAPPDANPIEFEKPSKIVSPPAPGFSDPVVVVRSPGGGVQVIRGFVNGKSPLPSARPLPETPESRFGEVVPTRTDGGSSGQPLHCRLPPRKPTSPGICKFYPIRNTRGCIVNWECVPVGRRQSHVHVRVPGFVPFAVKPFDHCIQEPVRPEDTSVCKWIPHIDSSGCIIRYKCAALNCETAPSKPQETSGCRWVVVTDEKGCVIDYQCEPTEEETPSESRRPERPEPCPPGPFTPIDTIECTHEPIRDVRGCITDYRCQSRGGGGVRVNLPQITSRRPLVIATVPPEVEEVTPEPPQVNPRHCPAQPVKPRDSPNCNWISLVDTRGCLHSYHCEPRRNGFFDGGAVALVEEATSEPKKDDECLQSPVAPAPSSRCRWVAIKDRSGCDTAFECEPIFLPRTTRSPCPERPKKPRDSRRCRWQAVKDRDDCIVEYECEPDCVDLSPHCNYWAQYGYCYRNPDYMAAECRETCRLC